MRVIQRGTYKGKKFEVGKITYLEKDKLNTERSFNAALKTLNAIRKDAELLLYGKLPSLEKNIYGKRKVG